MYNINFDLPVIRWTKNTATKYLKTKKKELEKLLYYSSHSKDDIFVSTNITRPLD